MATPSDDLSPPQGGLAGRLRAQARRLMEGERSALTRLAGAAFLVRAASAAIAFVSQVLMARWMGAFEFGIYVYVWTWTIMLGTLAPLGLGSAAQRFLPEYAERGEHGLLHGFLRGGRWLAFWIGTLFALAGTLVMFAFERHVEGYYLVPFLLAFACLPLYAVSEVQDGIARSNDWVGLGLVPVYIGRPLMILAAMGAMHMAGVPASATAAMAAAAAATWLAALGQMLELDRRLRRRAAARPPAPRIYDRAGWLKVALPIFMVDGFYFLLTYTDILTLELFVTPDQVAIYFAATKTLAPVAFVYFSVAAAVTHKFTAFHVAGERDKLERFLADTIHWIFWPSLAAAAALLAVGRYILAMFGPGFEAGYPLLFVLALGLLVRAAVGPVERLLIMLGHQSACAIIYGVAFVANFGLCLLLIPPFGLMGAAWAPTLAYALESILLFVFTKRRLGLHVFVLRRPVRR
ncbi:MAG TPA: lipopolysaccharide biosynthesis protein [Xanthobacteraceae bacterium]|nr:lipopolysaccharide biosynthesis protein [Xanthobacteraceae bacterium]